MAINITLPTEKLTFSRWQIKRVRNILKDNPAGIYFLYDSNDELLYVGKTNNFLARLHAHFRGRDVARCFYRKIDYVTVYFVESSYEREIYETYAINMFKPVFNRSKVYNYDRSDTIDEIDERIRELEEERDEIIEEMTDDELFEEEYEELEDYAVGTFFYNQKRLEEIEREISELKAKKRRLV